MPASSTVPPPRMPSRASTPTVPTDWTLISFSSRGAIALAPAAGPVASSSSSGAATAPPSTPPPPYSAPPSAASEPSAGTARGGAGAGAGFFVNSQGVLFRSDDEEETGTGGGTGPLPSASPLGSPSVDGGRGRGVIGRAVGLQLNGRAVRCGAGRRGVAL